MFSVSWLTALKILWKVDEEEDDEELDDNEDDGELDELEEELWLELVDSKCHSAVGCELSSIFESVPTTKDTDRVHRSILQPRNTETGPLSHHPGQHQLGLNSNGRPHIIPP
jgi:hypothetical protein